MATNGNVNFQEGQGASDTAQHGNSGTSNLGKDEVGWYFVEQFYNTLSRSPEKLHLFYGKRSQFVYGKEAQVSNVSVGRQAIQERIKDLDFQDCKVRVTNVDSMGAHENIVIQVIGEVSNKSQDSKKFVQTFVLAQQPSGYFVLNDIMRYIDEEVEDTQPVVPAPEEAPATTEPEAAAPPETHTEPAPEAAKADKPPQEAEAAPLDADVVDKKLEDVSSTADENTPATTETSAESTVEAEPAVVKTQEDAQPEPMSAEQANQEIAEEEVKEVPSEPTPTPAAPRPTPAEKPAPAEPEKPKEPPKPMTWASRIAAAAAPLKAAIPALPKTSTPPAQSQPRQAAPAPAPAKQAPAAATQETTPAAAASKDQNDEWQTAGADSKRQNRPVSISGPQETGREGAMAYIKYVTDKVQADDLRAALAQYGELAYFDVNRQKNCAFVEFKTQAGYNAAVGANPHTVNGENIVVEQRRPKANAYGGSNYSNPRGGSQNRGGRGGFEGGQRQAGQGGPRTGGFQGQARGRGGAARGGARAGSQTAA